MGDGPTKTPNQTMEIRKFKIPTSKQNLSLRLGWIVLEATVIAHEQLPSSSLVEDLFWIPCEDRVDHSIVDRAGEIESRYRRSVIKAFAELFEINALHRLTIRLQLEDNDDNAPGLVITGHDVRISGF
jgi:hypothetical protein